MTFRSKALLETARGQLCTMRGPTCNYDPATTVWAHSRRLSHGKGIGKKANDCFGAHLCSACHDLYDGRTKANEYSRAYVDALFERARDATLLRLFEQGSLKVL